MPAIKMGEFPPEMNEVSRPGILSRAFLRETRPRRSRHTSPLDKRHATRAPHLGGESSNPLRRCPPAPLVDTPTTEVVGFLLQTPLRFWRVAPPIRLAQCPQAYIPVCPTVFHVRQVNDSPFFRMFIAALTSRLCFAWQFGHSHSLTERFFTNGFLHPQQLHI